jgi:hypothetical protein
MGLGASLKKLIRPEQPEPEPERDIEAPESSKRRPLSDEERERLIEEARSDLPELDAKVEKNLDRLRGLSRS